MHLLCGQKVPWDAFPPHRTPLAWMKVFICNRLSTKRVPGVDERCQKDAVPPQKKYLRWRQSASMTVHPQKNTLFVDKRHLQEQLLHKKYPFCGRKGPGEEPQTKKNLHFCKAFLCGATRKRISFLNGSISSR